MAESKHLTKGDLMLHASPWWLCYLLCWMPLCHPLLMQIPIYVLVSITPPSPTHDLLSTTKRSQAVKQGAGRGLVFVSISCTLLRHIKSWIKKELVLWLSMLLLVPQTPTSLITLPNAPIINCRISFATLIMSRKAKYLSVRKSWRLQAEYLV